MSHSLTDPSKGAQPAQEETHNTNGPSSKETRPESPIAAAIDNYLHRIRDIQVCLVRYMPLAITQMHTTIDKVKEQLDVATKLLAAEDRPTQVKGIRMSLSAIRRTERLRRTQLPQVLESSLFLGIFSAFDVFTGDLLRAIYTKKPDLFKGIKREVPFSDILQYSSLQELQTKVLEDEIETFRRKSYVEQFEFLERTFGLSLTKFQEWSAFVEFGQRRNLFTHCGGAISQQYLDICKANGVGIDNSLKAGDKVQLGGKYLIPCTEVMMEVGLMLGQTLWRKILPDEYELANKHLNDVLYQSLLLEHWNRAIIFGHFAQSEMIRKTSSDIDRKVATVNLAIALKFSGKNDDSLRLLSETDWSSALPELKLANAVLHDEFEAAAKIMLMIGKRGEY